MSSKFVNNFWSYPADKQTNKGKIITSLAEFYALVCGECMYGDAPSYVVDLITQSAVASATAGLRSAERSP